MVSNNDSTYIVGYKLPLNIRWFQDDFSEKIDKHFFFSKSACFTQKMWELRDNFLKLRNWNPKYTQNMNKMF